MTDEREIGAGLTERAHHAGDGKPAAPRQRRMSAKRKREAVLRILRGKDLELVNRDPGVTAAGLSGCVERPEGWMLGAASAQREDYEPALGGKHRMPRETPSSKAD